MFVYLYKTAFASKNYQIKQTLVNREKALPCFLHFSLSFAKRRLFWFVYLAKGLSEKQIR